MKLETRIAFALALFTTSLPDGAAASPADSTLWQSVHGFFTWNHGEAGVHPIIDVDVGRKTSVGAALFLRELGLPQNQLRVSLAGGLDGLIEVAASDRLTFDRSAASLFLRGHYRRRPDGLFYGLGGETRAGDKTVFAVREPEVEAGFDRRFLEVIGLELGLAFRAPRFDGSDSMSTPNLESRFGGTGQPPVPFGFGGYQLLYGRAALVIDSRAERPAGSGVRLGAEAGYGIDPGATSTRLVKLAGQAAGFVDFSGRGHRFGIALDARLVEKLGVDPVPFTELVALGGERLMRGFLPGRLRGDSALVGSLYYQQPIGPWLRGELFVDAGNVFPGRLRQLDITDIYGAYGLELETTLFREARVALLAGFGTTRVDASDFDAIDDVRLNLSVNQRF